MKNLKHEYDISLELDQDVENIVRATYFASEPEKVVDDGGFDCAGTVGTFGSAGGCAGTFGTFGCCC